MNTMEGDFSEQEIKTITKKFEDIGFECKYVSFNKLKVYTNYDNYELNVHKDGDGYYFLIYRPTIGMFVNSNYCQKILCEKTHYETIGELVNHVKNIKNIIIENSVVVKDICEDMSNYLNQIYSYSHKMTTEEFIDDMRNISCDLHKLCGNITNKIYINNTPH
jgi:hypothetical protein